MRKTRVCGVCSNWCGDRHELSLENSDGLRLLQEWLDMNAVGFQSCWWLPLGEKRGGATKRGGCQEPFGANGPTLQRFSNRGGLFGFPPKRGGCQGQFAGRKLFLAPSALWHQRERRRGGRRRPAVPRHPPGPPHPDARGDRLRRLRERPQLPLPPRFARPGGQQGVEGRRPDVRLQDRRPVRQPRRDLGEALPRLLGGRVDPPAADDHGDRLHDRRPRHRRSPGPKPDEHVPGPVRAGLESHRGLPAARPRGRGRQPDLRVLQA
jgi:hypothetical protein